MSHWLELFDSDLSRDEIPLPERPLYVAKALCREGAFKLRTGVQSLDISNPQENFDTDWFRAIFAAVEYWYVEHYGPSVYISNDKNNLLEGAILIRGIAYALNVMAHRVSVETEGETLWLHFEDRLGEGDDPVKWIVNGPELTALNRDTRNKVTSDAKEVATVLRFIRYHSGMANVEDPETRKLCEASWNYLQQTSRRIVAGNQDDRGLAWFDLQMANETALKAVIRHTTSTQPYIHSLPNLLIKAEECGVITKQNLLSEWPDFKTISEWRYGQGDAGRLDTLFSAYLTTLRLVQACMKTIPPIQPPGFKILIRYPPWKIKPDGVAHRPIS